MATFEDFQKLDIRVGRIIDVQYFPEARKPSYKLKIDLGEEVGIKKFCAQLPQNYKINDLIGKAIAPDHFWLNYIDQLKSELNHCNIVLYDKDNLTG